MHVGDPYLWQCINEIIVFVLGHRALDCNESHKIIEEKKMYVLTHKHFTNKSQDTGHII